MTLKRRVSRSESAAAPMPLEAAIVIACSPIDSFGSGTATSSKAVPRMVVFGSPSDADVTVNATRVALAQPGAVRADADDRLIRDEILRCQRGLDEEGQADRNQDEPGSGLRHGRHRVGAHVPRGQVVGELE